MQYVIGVDGGSTKSLMKASDMQGNLLASSVSEMANHNWIGKDEAKGRIARQIEELIHSFDGKKEDCACIVVGAAGIDSPETKRIIGDIYEEAVPGCPVFCMNDGNIALYATTKGVGVLAISGTGSIAVGRNAAGQTTRSGGYISTIFSNEGSGEWIAKQALHYLSKWLDGSVGSSALTEKLDAFFGGADVHKLVDYAVLLRTKQVDAKIAVWVYEAALEGDEAALDILKRGACALSGLTCTCAEKLGWKKEDAFLSGVWGSVLVKNELFFQYYKEAFLSSYPNSSIVLPKGDAADGAVQMALDYLAGKAAYIEGL